MNISVVIGRFQVSELTEGHLELLNYAESVGPLLVLIGTSPALPNKRNPLPFYLRECMVREAFQDAVIMPLMDAPSDELWSARVDAAIQTAFPFAEATIYGGRDSCLPHYKGRHKTWRVDTPEDLLGSRNTGTDQRQMLADFPGGSAEFRAGIIHARMNEIPTVHQAVDLAVVRKREVCLIRKAVSTGWQLPGGFVDPTDESLELAARRELLEETGLSVEGALRYVGSFRVDDWRYRGVPDRAITTVLFVAPYSFGLPVGGDDAAEAAFWSLDDLPPIAASHLPLITLLKDYLG